MLETLVLLCPVQNVPQINYGIIHTDARLQVVCSWIEALIKIINTSPQLCRPHLISESWWSRTSFVSFLYTFSSSFPPLGLFVEILCTYFVSARVPSTSFHWGRTGGPSGDGSVQIKFAALRHTIRKAVMWITQKVPVIILPPLPVAELQACKLVGAGLVESLPCWVGERAENNVAVCVTEQIQSLILAGEVESEEVKITHDSDEGSPVLHATHQWQLLKFHRGESHFRPRHTMCPFIFR